jgi:sec-independent protein translocase protein TatA
MIGINVLYALSGFIGLPGGPEIVIVLVIVLLIFAPKRLPSLGRSIGDALANFRKGVKGVEDEEENPDKEQQDANK